MNLGILPENGYKERFRTMIISKDEEKLTLPVTPQKYSVSAEQDNRIVDILDFGERLIFGNPKLKRLKVSCFLPALKHKYPFVVGDAKEPEDIVALLTKWKEDKSPVRVIITESPVNLMMALMDFDYKERDGTRDIYYDLQFTEHKEFNVPPANYTKNIDTTTGLKDQSRSTNYEL